MDPSWINALLGGALIGLASTLMLLANGRITGVSGIFFGALRPQKNDTLWRIQFLLGLLVGGALAGTLIPEAFTSTTSTPLWLIGMAGLLVGYGTGLGSGCTSGHGVCGISRLSPRSIVATLTFMASGMITVWVMRHLLGGQL